MRGRLQSRCQLLSTLAVRLADIFAKHPVLHMAQEAFVKGGSVHRCIDTCLDAWEIAHVRRVGCYNIFYDVKAAYDCVQHPDLLRSLRRLAMPQAFINLVADSLSRLTSCVRTAYGETADFAVKRSVRQGDPLAPLLYVCHLDPLHCGLEVNPVYGGARDGFVLNRDQTVSSKGFADDTWAVSGSLAGLQRMNDWVTTFCRYNHLTLNGSKTEMVGRDDRTGACMVNTSIEVAGVLVEPKPMPSSPSRSARMAAGGELGASCLGCVLC